MKTNGFFAFFGCSSSLVRTTHAHARSLVEQRKHLIREVLLIGVGVNVGGIDRILKGGNDVRTIGGGAKV